MAVPVQTEMAVFSSEEDALRAAVQHAGGAKVIGCEMWPDISPEAAQTKLLNALNELRPERLKPSQVRLILRRAHARGYHAAAQYFMADVGYSVTVIDPVAQQDRAIEAVAAAADNLGRAMAMLERIQRVQPVGSKVAA